MPDASVRESKERVRTAIKNSGYEIYSKKFVINLAPASTKKEGSYYDLAIAIGVLKNMGVIKNVSIEGYVFIGELSLNGKINAVNGILPMCIECQKKGIKSVFIPCDNKDEAIIIEGINIYPVESLKQLIDHINGKCLIKKYVKSEIKNYQDCRNDSVDFKDIKGQSVAKRALEIVAAGAHNCIMIGSPGCGKTMLAKALDSILPELTFENSLETTKIHSVSGILKAEMPLVARPPFRMPHHTISKAAFCGGGRNTKPGEISLANNGVLYLDEIAEFDKNILECLRVPLEDKRITISRMNMVTTYPANFILLASMNPCPCGYYMDKKRRCVCTDGQIFKYLNKLSGPLLDRIDIRLEIANIEYSDLKDETPLEASKDIRRRVERARQVQMKRYEEYGIQYNSELTKDLLKKYCSLDNAGSLLLEKVYEKYCLSARAVDKILKVARTIADLAEDENISAEHVAEAAQYNVFDSLKRGVII